VFPQVKARIAEPRIPVFEASLGHRSEPLFGDRRDAGRRRGRVASPIPATTGTS